MRVSATELEKTIVFLFLMEVKGDMEMYIDSQTIVNKFRPMQKRMARKYMEKLAMKRMLEKHPKADSYRITEMGLRYGKTLISRGVVLP